MWRDKAAVNRVLNAVGVRLSRSGPIETLVVSLMKTDKALARWKSVMGGEWSSSVL